MTVKCQILRLGELAPHKSIVVVLFVWVLYALLCGKVLSFDPIDSYNFGELEGATITESEADKRLIAVIIRRDYKQKLQDLAWCTGYVKDKSTVIAPAHCMLDFNFNYLGKRNQLMVVSRTDTINPVNPDAIYRSVDTVYMPRLFGYNYILDADIMILELSTELPEEYENVIRGVFKDPTCRILGWTSEDKDAGMAGKKYLSTIEGVQILDRGTCEKEYKKVSDGGSIQQGKVTKIRCVKTDRRSQCAGDWSAVLICKGEMGLAALSEDCEAKRTNSSIKSIGFYTSVKAYKVFLDNPEKESVCLDSSYSLKFNTIILLGTQVSVLLQN